VTGGQTTGALDHVLARARDPESYARWLAQVRQAGYCSHPVRLAGRTIHVDPVSGEARTVFDTNGEPDGSLIKACGTRRESRCPSCAAIYRSDAWQLIAAGLRGGKGVPEDLATHPIVFATLTAPSFGAVHSRDRGGKGAPCHPHSSPTACPHGRSDACSVVHDQDDQQLGTPLCWECFDYEGLIIWNALASSLWSRTTTYLRRAVARSTVLDELELNRRPSIAYARIIEYQRRGAIHVHAVIRLDLTGERPSETVRLRANRATDALTSAVMAAAGAASVPYPGPWADSHGSARWGSQIDVRPVVVDGGDGLPAQAVAAYIAKYATKSTDGPGRLDHRLHESDITTLGVPPHLGQLVATAWRLGGRKDLADLRLQYWAHTLGFRGHWLTKSRSYSTTLTALRTARVEWAARRRRDELGHHGSSPPEGEGGVILKDWRYVGSGYVNQGDSWLAETAGREIGETKRIARQEVRWHLSGTGGAEPEGRNVQ